MKFQNVVVLFTAVVSATAPPTCKNSAPSYCKYTSNRDANECRRLFAKSYINVATCQLPAKTVTSTRTQCATRVTTKTVAPPPRTTKVYKTITKTGKPTTLPTITVTTTSTKIDTTVLTDSTTTVDLRTTTEFQTNRVRSTRTITSTKIITTTVPFDDQVVCTRKKRALGKSLPTSCSCFLTTTKPAATKTAIVTKNKPAVTHTVYKFGGPRKVISRTITIFRYVAGPTVSAPETTTTSTATVTQTDHTLTTVTDSQITTATEVEEVTDIVVQTNTETATATATKSPCDDAGSWDPIQQEIAGSSIQVTTSKDALGPDAVKSCCQSCYARPNCVFFRVGGNVCEVFSSVPSFSDSCTSPLCPRGFPSLSFYEPDGKDYYLGPCIGTSGA
ncbi:uncharacterized protein NECHADRAFT_77280 [Fusarium vanettenii 77-13-4]|uniref:Apple domain-containing protein n=1 Tax=Fusarium vanettenii (strain ATCC MYA-4622 / CBS 123669 / FGSC 9596 / NRRL 45880 / 77-13-4) TaxID=660122 RepID=C7YKS7_FUSV7|nr:uncharacterized protein NECHADRAFT_77280 [Fusarium vanettenii 77-13-4]EEU46669.1 predicted protein [Fusarium vanettenii 77-13-4]